MLARAKDLSHVLWIGGSPCAGKSTIGHNIARSHVFLGYFLDPMARNHVKRRVAQGDEKMAAFLKLTIDQRWVERSVDALVEEVLESWTVEAKLAVEDLVAMPQEWFIVAEGNFFPEAIAPYLSSPKQAIWLVPTPSFADKVRRQREAIQAERCKRQNATNESRDPEKHLQNIIDRDIRLAAHVKEQAARLNLTCVEVDDRRSLDEMTELVVKHFEPYLMEKLPELNRGY